MSKLKMFGFVLLGITAIGVLGIFASSLGTIGSVVTAPGRVLTKTLETNNIIESYEWYYDANATINSRIGQIKTHRDILEETTDASEKSRLRIETAAMQQSCRQLVEQYNANSQKMNKSIFQGWTLPDNIAPNSCE